MVTIVWKLETFLLHEKCQPVLSVIVASATVNEAVPVNNGIVISERTQTDRLRRVCCEKVAQERIEIRHTFATK